MIHSKKFRRSLFLGPFIQAGVMQRTNTFGAVLLKWATYNLSHGVEIPLGLSGFLMSFKSSFSLSNHVASVACTRRTVISQ